MAFEAFSEICEQLVAMIEQALKIYQEQQKPLNLGAVMRDYLAQYPRAGRHIGIDELDNHAFLMDFQDELEEFYPTAIASS